MYFHDNNLYDWAISDSLPYEGIKFDRKVKSEDILNTPDDLDIGFFREIDLEYPDIINGRTKFFPFAPESKKTDSDIFTP